jgi:phosphopantothenate synthetase
VPRVTAFNLRSGDDLDALGAAITTALTSLPVVTIDPAAVDLVPMLAPAGYEATVARIDVDLFERPTGTKERLQELGERIAAAFQDVVGADRRVKVVLRPYALESSGWVER